MPGARPSLCALIDDMRAGCCMHTVDIVKADCKCKVAASTSVVMVVSLVMVQLQVALPHHVHAMLAVQNRSFTVLQTSEPC